MFATLQFAQIKDRQCCMMFVFTNYMHLVALADKLKKLL